MWIKILLNKYRVFYVPIGLVYSRIHKNQLTQKGRALFERDTKTITIDVLNSLKENSDRSNRLVLYYAKYCAKHHCSDALSYIFEQEKKRKSLFFTEKVALYFVFIYGCVRPFFKRIYYFIKRR